VEVEEGCSRRCRRELKEESSSDHVYASSIAMIPCSCRPQSRHLLVSTLRPFDEDLATLCSPTLTPSQGSRQDAHRHVGHDLAINGIGARFRTRLSSLRLQAIGRPRRQSYPTVRTRGCGVLIFNDSSLHQRSVPAGAVVSVGRTSAASEAIPLLSARFS